MRALDVQLTEGKPEDITSILAFDKDFVAFNATKDNYRIQSSRRVMTKNRVTGEEIRLDKLSNESDLFFYYDNKLIFHSITNCKETIELFLIPWMEHCSFPPEAQAEGDATVMMMQKKHEALNINNLKN